MHCACGLVAVNDLVHRARADVLQLRPRRAPRRYGYTAGAALISQCKVRVLELLELVLEYSYQACSGKRCPVGAASI